MDQELQSMIEQQETAKNLLVEQWQNLATRGEDMTRILGGEVHEDDADLMLLCVKVCLAQCLLMWTESQLRALCDAQAGMNPA